MPAFLFLLLGLASGFWWFRRRDLLATGPYRAGWLLPLTLLASSIALWPSWFFTRKLIGLWLQPTALTFVLLVVACLFSTRGTGRVLLLIATGLFGLATTPWLANQLLTPLERPFWAIAPLDAEQPFDAVLVLGGGATWGPRENPQLSARGDRLRLAAALYDRDLTTVLVISGSSASGIDATVSARALWRDMGVPSSIVVALPKARNTAQEMDEYAKLIAERGWHRVGIITSASHMRRARFLWESRGLSLVPLPADFRTGPPKSDPQKTQYLALIPSSASLRQVETATWEYLGLVAARLTGD